MLKFLNRRSSSIKGKEDDEREFRISITSVQGGAKVELDMIEDGKSTLEDILLTPMDAALFIHETEKNGYCSCRIVGHGSDGKALMVCKEMADKAEWYFVGYPTECEISTGGIVAYVPSFVIEAMADALRKMMDSLLYPSTGDLEEEFG